MTGKEKAEVRHLLERKRREGAQNLSEYESLQVLQSWGLPVVKFHFARDADEAAGFAGSAGYPVVVKGIIPSVAHKTEKGLVHPWVRGESELRRVVSDLPAECAGYLIEEHVTGIRELVMGIVRDPTFGASVLVAMGGVHSELIADVGFVLAPVGEEEARGAIGRLKCSKMLGPYRGEEPARMKLLTGMIQQLGELAVEVPQIKELDINPVILRKDGTPVACSGLIVL